MPIHTYPYALALTCKTQQRLLGLLASEYRSFVNLFRVDLVLKA